MAKSFKLSSTPFLLVALTLLLGRHQTECSTETTNVATTAADLTTSGFAVDTTVQQSSIAAETTVTQPPTPTDAPTTQPAVTSPPALTTAPAGGADTSPTAQQQTQSSPAAPAGSPAASTTQQPVAGTSGIPPIPLATTIISPGGVTSQSNPSTSVQPAQAATTQPAGTGPSTTNPPAAVTSSTQPGQITTPRTQSNSTNVTTTSQPAGNVTSAPPTTAVTPSVIILSLSGPASAVRQEEFRLVATVTNLGSEKLTVKVTLHKSDNFNVRTPNDKNKHNTSVELIVEVLGKTNGSVNFWVVPHKLGLVTFYVTAVVTSGGNADTSSSVDVMVLSEGLPRQYTMSVVADPSANVQFKSIFNVSLPDNVISESVNITVTAVGDLLGQSLDGLEQLVHMPSGCGEQTMIGLAPDVYILRYLRAVGKNKPEIEQRTLSYINAGYQRELTFRRNDGSFSAFGNGDYSGSVWLTAFVVKCFHEAKKLTNAIRDAEIIDALNWLAKHHVSGAFNEVGFVYHVDMQGQASRGVPLTAYVLIALEENRDLFPQASVEVSNAATAAKTYLEGKLTSNDNALEKPYVLSLVCYALKLATRSSPDACVNKLDTKAVYDGGYKHWRKLQEACPSWWYTSWGEWMECVVSVDIEMTGYGLLTLVGTPNTAHNNNISKWIISQRNGMGGFMSTQDTVVALQSLAQFAEIEGSAGTQKLDVRLNDGTTNYNFDPITGANALQLQSKQMNPNAKEITVTADGTGTAVVQLIVKYNIGKGGSPSARRRRAIAVAGTETPHPINIRTTQFKVDDKHVVLEACASYDSSSTNESSGMSIMQIAMPTGYEPVNYNAIKGPELNDTIRKVEYTQNTGVVLYLTELTSDGLCVNLTVNKAMSVANVKPATVSAYLYYNPGVKETLEYASVIDNGTDWCVVCPECCACLAPSYFTCDVDRCLVSSKKCDKVGDCVDGSDEQGCNDASTLMHHPAAFSALLVAIGNALLTLVACNRYLLI